MGLSLEKGKLPVSTLCVISAEMHFNKETAFEIDL